MYIVMYRYKLDEAAYGLFDSYEKATQFIKDSPTADQHCYYVMTLYNP